MTDKYVQCTRTTAPDVVKVTDVFHQHHGKDVACEANTSAEEGRCYMMDTEFKMIGGSLVAAASLAIGDKVLDSKGNTTTVTWCRKLPKRRRLLVDMHAKPLTVTGTHRVVVHDGEVEAIRLKEHDEVLIGSQRQRLHKVTRYYKSIEVMEVEFAGDATIEVHTPSILTKGSDPSVPIDEVGDLKCKREPEDEDSMSAFGMGACTGSVSTDHQAGWPDTDDDLR